MKLERITFKIKILAILALFLNLSNLSARDLSKNAGNAKSEQNNESDNSGTIDRLEIFNAVCKKLAETIHYRELFEFKRKRGANKPLRKAMFILYKAETWKFDFDKVFQKVFEINGTPKGYQRMLRASLLRNYKHCLNYGLFETEENLLRLKKGRTATITKGEYAGEEINIDHIIPVHHVPILDRILVNLEVMPRSLNLKKSDSITKRALIGARRLTKVGMLKQHHLAVIEKVYREENKDKF